MYLLLYAKGMTMVKFSSTALQACDIQYRDATTLHKSIHHCLHTMEFEILGSCPMKFLLLNFLGVFAPKMKWSCIDVDIFSKINNKGLIILEGRIY